MNRKSSSATQKPSAGHARSGMGIGHAVKAAEFLLEQIEADRYKADLIPSFMTALVSSVEGRVNEAIIDYFYYKCGGGYRGFAKGVLAMPLKERIAFAPALLSDFKILVNDKNPLLHTIYRLIDLRNALVHVKPHWFAANWDDNSIHYVKPEELDPYSRIQGLYDFPLDQLRGYSEAAASLVYAFRRLQSRIRSARFRPEPWFSPAVPGVVQLPLKFPRG